MCLHAHHACYECLHKHHVNALCVWQHKDKLLFAHKPPPDAWSANTGASALPGFTALLLLGGMSCCLRLHSPQPLLPAVTHTHTSDCHILSIHPKGGIKTPMTSFSQAKCSLVLTALTWSLKPRVSFSSPQEHFRSHTSFAAFFSCTTTLFSRISSHITQQPFSRRLERRFTSCYCSYSHLHQLLRGWKSPSTHQCFLALRHPNASLGNTPPNPAAVQLGVQ